jgi:hypothetical protein
MSLAEVLGGLEAMGPGLTDKDLPPAWRYIKM